MHPELKFGILIPTSYPFPFDIKFGVSAEKLGYARAHELVIYARVELALIS